MKEDINKLKDKLFFTIEDIIATLDIKRESAWVLCSRYIRNGTFLRIKKNVYVFRNDWKNIPKEKSFEISNYLQVPSYISFLTALSYFEVTMQVVRDFYENVSLKRSIRYTADSKEFIYFKMNEKYYFDFEKQENFFIATKEKAFIDSIYLYSFGKYSLDLFAIDITKLNISKIKETMEIFPVKTQKIIKKICRI